MRWTQEIPKVPGWYWWRHKNWLGPAIVTEITERHLNPKHPSPLGGEWSDTPLTPPADAREDDNGNV
jgi:hypothetical protein